MKIRKAAVAGRFYPSNKKELSDLLKKITKIEKTKIETKLAEKNIIGGVVPHAGYMFSAYQAVHFFEILHLSENKFDTFIIINPNHTSYGPEIAIDSNDFWETPYGNSPLDKEFAEELNLTFASEAHQNEHSGEVMIPMLYHFLNYDFKFVPITISNQNAQNASIVAERIHKVSEKLNRNICVIASTDFSHYIDPDEGRKKDMEVIDKILKFDSKGVINTVRNKKISMCGFGPVAALIEYSKLYSVSKKAKLLRFGHSGEVSPSNEVVDYASILIYEDS